MRYRKTIRVEELSSIMHDLLERYLNTVDEERASDSDKLESFGMYEMIDMIRNRLPDEINKADVYLDLDPCAPPEKLREHYGIEKQF